jgi:hypothetical protein
MLLAQRQHECDDGSATNGAMALRMNKIWILLLTGGMLAIPAMAQKTLPSGEITEAFGNTAQLIAPTRRYAHGALGDDVEAGGFRITRGQTTLEFFLPETEVFEDLRVRLVDVTSDNKPEAIIIRSHINKGASIAVYDIQGEAIKLFAESPFIGRANRWLNIVGVADFTGQGRLQIAAVVTPHLAGSLRVYDFQGKSLVERARIDGYTNHINGSRHLDLAVIEDVNGDGIADITLPRLGSENRVTITFHGGNPREL